MFTSTLIPLLILPLTVVAEDQFGTPRGDEGTRIFKATEHQNYSGHFRISGRQTTLVGSMQDHSQWDHLDYAGKRLQSVQGKIELDVNERTNTGQIIAEFQEGTDQYRIVFDRFMDGSGDSSFCKRRSPGSSCRGKKSHPAVMVARLGFDSLCL